MSSLSPSFSSLAPAARRPSDTETSYCTPPFETETEAHSLRITVWVPGVNTSGIEITTRGPDLTLLAHKALPVRSNWRALHLEAAQRDYRLNLRLGHGFDFGQLRAHLNAGELTIDIPVHPTAATRTGNDSCHALAPRT